MLWIYGWGISFEIAHRWWSQDLTDDKSTLVQIMVWCRQATSHYLSQCCPRPLSPYGVTRPQWVNPTNIEPDVCPHMMPLSHNICNPWKYDNQFRYFNRFLDHRVCKLMTSSNSLSIMQVIKKGCHTCLWCQVAFHQISSHGISSLQHRKNTPHNFVRFWWVYG